MQAFVVQKFEVAATNMAFRTDRLVEAMDKSGYTQAQIAQHMGTTQSNVSHWRNGARPRDIKSLARLLGVSVEWIHDETDDPTPIVSTSDLDPFQRKAATWIEQNRHRTDPEFVATLLLMGYSLDEISELTGSDIPKQLTDGSDVSGISEKN